MLLSVYEVDKTTGEPKSRNIWLNASNVSHANVGSRDEGGAARWYDLHMVGGAVFSVTPNDFGAVEAALRR